MAFDPEALAACAGQIVAMAGDVAARGWVPATSGNFSMRLGPQHIAITVSGRDKGRLTEADIMLMDLRGQPIGTGLRPSAEALLHAQLYAARADIGCVLHTHSRNQTVASRVFASQGSVRLSGYELLKAFPGIDSHERAIDVPILANNQDMAVLADLIAPRLGRPPAPSGGSRPDGASSADDGTIWGYLIEGHGMYAWGRDPDEARRHLEAFDFLLGCALDLRRYS